MKTVQELVNVISDVTVKGAVDMAVSHITADSREVKAGSLFICLTGAHVNGHDYVNKAVEAGAVAILASEPIEVSDTVTVLTVKDTRIAMQQCVPFFYDYPGCKMRMIGVTGTNGKTTTTHIIGHILRAQEYKVGIIGTVHVMIGDKTYPIHNTTPDVVDLQHILSQMVAEGVTHCIMEVSSHALALNRVAGVEYDTAVFTNLTQDHLDFHKTFENYLAAKCKLFEQVSAPNQHKKNKGAVINIDDPYGERVMAKNSAPLITYGTKGKGTLEGENLTITAKTSAYDIVYEGKEYPIHIRITGLFNVYNTLAAIGACLFEGVSMEDIIKALSDFTAVPGRFELVEEGQPFAVVVDYAHTPDGLENILQTAQKIVERHIIVVFGCGGDRDVTKRPIMGRIAAQYGDGIFVTSDNPRTEDPEKIVAQVAEGVKEGLREGSVYTVITDRRSAIHAAIKAAKAGDVVIIAGKGHEDYQILKDKTIHFDDREVAREALKER